MEVKNNTHIFVYCYLWNGTTNSGKLFFCRVIGGLVLLMAGLHNGLMLPKFKSFLLCSLPHIVLANTVTRNSICVTLTETEKTKSVIFPASELLHPFFVCLFVCFRKTATQKAAF